MPIDYARNYEKELVNWDNIFKYLNQFPLFHNNKTQQKFLEAWKKEIIRSENQSYQNFSMKVISENEHFPLKILFGGNWLGWSALNIDKIETIIYNEYNQELPVKISISQFLDEHKHLEGKTWFEPTDKIIYYPKRVGEFSYIPILVFNPSFPYPFSAVIDGSHRVKTAVSENHSDISAYLITEAFLFSHPEIFMDEFSRSIFLFCCDLIYFHNKKHLSDYVLPSKFSKHLQEDSCLFHFLNISWLE